MNYFNQGKSLQYFKKPIVRGLHNQTIRANIRKQRY